MEGDGRPFTCSSFVRQMGLTFDNFIPIHQAHSYCRKPLLPPRQLTGILMGAFNGIWISYLHVPAFVVTLGSQLVFKGLMLALMKSASIGLFPELYSAVSLKFIADPFQGGSGFHPLTLIIGAASIALYLLIVFQARKKQVQNGLEVSGNGSFISQTVPICAAILLFAYMLAVHNGIPYILILLVLLTAAYSFMGNNTTLGRRLYQVGGNEKAAALSGIRTKNITFFAFVNMGLLAALAGIVYSARLNFATPTAGDGFELDAIASCFIGGASPSGGVGTIRGAITDALIMGVLNNGMSLMGLGIETQKAVKGMVLILAVLLDVIGRRRAESK